jgi:hypothetical protein
MKALRWSKFPLLPAAMPAVEDRRAKRANLTTLEPRSLFGAQTYDKLLPGLQPTESFL